MLIICGRRDNYIDVLYYKSIVEFNTHQDCMDTYKLLTERSVDSVIFIEKEDFQGIVNNLSQTKIEHGKKAIGDVICCVEHKSRIWGLTSFMDVCSKEDDHLNVDLQTIYKLLSISGFFNYKMPDDLYGNLLIKHYGFPSNYKEIEEEFPHDNIRKVRIKVK